LGEIFRDSTVNLRIYTRGCNFLACFSPDDLNQRSVPESINFRGNFYSNFYSPRLDDNETSDNADRRSTRFSSADNSRVDRSLQPLSRRVLRESAKKWRRGYGNPANTIPSPASSRRLNGVTRSSPNRAVLSPMREISRRYPTQSRQRRLADDSVDPLVHYCAHPDARYGFFALPLHRRRTRRSRTTARCPIAGETTFTESGDVCGNTA